MPTPSLNDHERRIVLLEERAPETLQAVNALADVTLNGFNRVDAKLTHIESRTDTLTSDLGAALTLLQRLAADTNVGFNAVFKMRVELATIHGKVDQILAALLRIVDGQGSAE